MGEIERFIATRPADWQRNLCDRLLAAQRRVDMGIAEAIKWGNPYFSHDGRALLKWYCAKKWINVYFFRGVELADPDGLFIDTDNKAMRTIRLFDDSVLDEAGYRDLVARALALDKS
jgi:hypothetical protein